MGKIKYTKGFKAFHSDMRESYGDSNIFQAKKSYTNKVGKKTLAYWKNITDMIPFYNDKNDRYFEVFIIGDSEKNTDTNTYYTNRLVIGRELTKDQISNLYLKSICKEKETKEIIATSVKAPKFLLKTFSKSKDFNTRFGLVTNPAVPKEILVNLKDDENETIRRKAIRRLNKMSK